MTSKNRKMNILYFIIIPFLLMLTPSASVAGDIPATDIEYVRMLLLQPNIDFSLFDGDELCDSLIYIIENDATSQRDMVVRRSLCALPETEDERAVEYLVDYIPDYPLDCLQGLGRFSTVDSCDALMHYVDNDDVFIRRFTAESLGRLDYTVSEEMWAKRDPVLARLSGRLEAETEDWMIPIIEASFTVSANQVFEAHQAEDE